MSAECDFIRAADGSYQCHVSSLKIVEPSTHMFEFKSNHLNIKRVIIQNQDVHFFPLSIPLFFPNLEELAIVNCKLKSIKADDLKGFDKLKTLNLSNNCLNYLPDDLFKHCPQLQRVSFQNNFINFKLFEKLQNLQNFDLKGNKLDGMKISF
jgi:Leucine-rich repeat (LRR) protein